MSEPAPRTETRYFSGLDLGQVSDYTALCVVERRITNTLPAIYEVRHLHRWHLGTPYTEMTADLVTMFAADPLKGSTLAIDRTGVGRGVFDMIRNSGITAACRSYTITTGSRPSPGNVPKRELVAAIQVPLQERRLRFAKSLPLTPILQAELEHFRVKVTADRNEQFEALRERDHDDLVLALALALYAGRVSGFAMSVVALPSPDYTAGWSKSNWVS